MKQDFNSNRDIIVSGLDNVTVIKCISDIPGGRTLNMEGFKDDKVPAGHIIIQLESGDYAPMPCHPSVDATDESDDVEGGFDALPAGASYVGINKHTILAKSPAASIMIGGVVNKTLIPFPTDNVWSEFKAACPHIIFTQDEEA